MNNIMDSNLEDTLNLEGDMGSMDFDHSGVVVSQEDITLETTGHEDDIPMEFEHIEEQPVLMDTGNEEIIISDFMGDQFGLQEYSIKDEATADASGTIEATQLHLIPSSQSDSMIDLQFDPMTMTTSVASDMSQHKYIAVKAAMAPPRGKKVESTTTSLPRQVAIAPKPPKLVPTVTKASFVPKQYAIAPKPVALVSNRSVVKKMVTGVIQSGSKTGNVLTQIGKQLVMVPSGGGQKIKLVTSGGGIPSVQYVRANSDQAQLIKNVAGSNPQKQMLAKVIVQGQSNMDSSQPAVITKLMPNTATPQTRYVMQQKTVPISIGGNKVLLASPTKQGVRFAKKQIIAIKSPTPKLMPMTSQSGTTAKKVVITTNPNQNVILKTTAPPKTTQVSKDGNVVVQAQRSQLHQINVPGKGIQYIRLITNPSPATHKQAPAPAPPAPGKNITLSDHKGWILDSKGNLLQMTTDKVSTGQPPPLVFSRNIVTTSKVSGKPQKTLVRLAPIASKPTQVATLQQQQTTRPSQSLLAPISAMSEVVLEEIPEALEEQSIHDGELEVSPERSEPEPADCKAGLRALVQDALGTRQPPGSETTHKLEVEFDGKPTPEEDSEGSIDDVRQSSNRSSDHPLIVIPSNYDKQERTRSDSDSRSMDERNYSNVVNIEVEGMPYLSPKQSLTLSETDLQSRTNDLGLRPRKACNCTKSQCLKLYCDCFANGEFCNRCNCNNCHNNLENEELRQKAIRTCLERNPNAFRPKIGKAKSGGPEIVRRHNKGCNCKRSGCLKNYCECYEAKIACTAMCKCVGCRNVEETLARRRDAHDSMLRPAARPPASRQPCSFMTTEVIEAVCQCLLAAAVEGGERDARAEPDPISDVIEEFARCLQDIVGASHQAV